jgi:hypothetical protein
MTIIGPKAFLALVALLALAGSANGQPVTISWPDAVAQLAGERDKAETCVALVKKYGGEAQISRAQLAYASAKADSDGVIAGLITALSLGQTPASLSSLQAKLRSGVSGLHEFCGTVTKLIPNMAGEKSVVVGVAKVAVEPLLKLLSDAVSNLYTNYQADDPLTRKTIQTQLEAARWPPFAEVQVAP